MSNNHIPVDVPLPKGVRCAIALTYDTDMAGGYAPDGICHGRTMPALQDYIMRLCGTAGQFGVRLQFFQIGNGLELPDVVEHVRQILKRGHIVDLHTYSHLPLITKEVQKLDDELALTNQLFEEKLVWKSTVLRGPGGYQNGLDGLRENQRVIQKNGFKWVSGRFTGQLLGRRGSTSTEGPALEPPYAYPTGLIEWPIQAATDRTWFDTLRCTDAEAYARWRKECGHKPIPKGWRAPWTDKDALDERIRYNQAVADFAYERSLACCLCWHPYSHYVHDPDNRALPALLAHCAAKPEKVWVCTMRDLVQMSVVRNT